MENSKFNIGDVIEHRASKQRGVVIGVKDAYNLAPVRYTLSYNIEETILFISVEEADVCFIKVKEVK